MAKGSHATRGGWEPKTCAVCTQPVRVSKDDCWFHFNDYTNRQYAFHFSCDRTDPSPFEEEDQCSPPSPTSP